MQNVTKMEQKLHIFVHKIQHQMTKKYKIEIAKMLQKCLHDEMSWKCYEMSRKRNENYTFLYTKFNTKWSKSVKSKITKVLQKMSVWRNIMKTERK